MEKFAISVIVNSDNKDEQYTVMASPEEVQRISNGGKWLFIIGNSAILI